MKTSITQTQVILDFPESVINTIIVPKLQESREILFTLF